MKILHSAFVAGYEPGILRQMVLEEEAANAIGFEWRSFLFVPQTSNLSGASVIRSKVSSGVSGVRTLDSLMFWSAFRRDYYRWLLRESMNHDVILLRHSMYDPFRINYISKCRRPIFSVHHTKEVPELLCGKRLSGTLKAFAESFFGARSIKRSEGIIGATKEVVDYEVKRGYKRPEKTFVYPNGISYDERKRYTLEDKRSLAVPELLFVASHFSPWRGLDLLLQSLSANQEQFLLHLVGEVSDEDKLMAEKDQRVILHGLCGQERLSELSESAWVGLSSFALERKSMNEACTLKVREYLLQGVPVYAGYHEVFPNDFPAYRRGPAEITKILEYARETRSLEKSDIARRAEPFISKSYLVKGLGMWLDQACR